MEDCNGSHGILMFSSSLPPQSLKIFISKWFFFFHYFNHCYSSIPKSIEQCGNGTQWITRCV